MAIRFYGKSATKTYVNDDSSTGAHRYWRLLVSENNYANVTGVIDGFVEVGSLELYDALDLGTVCTDEGVTDVYTASSEYSASYPPEYAFSPGVAPWASTLEYDYFYNRPVSSGQSLRMIPQWLQVEFVDAKDIQRLTLMSNGHMHDHDTRNFPRKLDFQYSDDGINWRTRFTSEITDWPNVESPDQYDPSASYYRSIDLQNGYGIVSLPSLTTSILGASDFQSFGASLTLPALTISLTLSVVRVDLPGLTGSGAGLVGNVSENYQPIKLPRLSAEGVLAPGQFSSATATLPALLGSGEGYQYGDLVGAILPSLTGAASALIGSKGSGALTLPVLGAAGVAYGPNDLTGGVISALTGAGQGASGAYGPIFAQLPNLSGSATAFNGEDIASLPSLSGSGAGIIGLPAVMYGYLSGLTSTGTGTLTGASQDGAGGLAGTLPSLEGSGLSVVGNVYEGSNVLPSLALAATGVTGTLGTVSIALPSLSATGTMVSGLNGAVSLSLPALRLVATSVEIGDAQLTGAALVMSLKHKAITTFTDYRFNSFATFQGVTLACSEDGLFALVGDDDNGAIIEASITLGNLDFDIQTLKTVDQVYVGYKSDGDLQLSVSADDGTLYSYPLLAQLGDVHHTARVKTGRGIKGRYLQLGISNVAGADFSIDTMEPEPRALNRRIR